MFLILPVGMDYRARRYPTVTFTLMGICAAVFVITYGCRLFGSDDANNWVFENLWLIPAENHCWTYVTSQFVHGGIFHIVGNMIYLYLFGACVEDMIGRVRFTLFYLLCGLAAALTFIIIASDHMTSTIPMGGASGAISGCIGGYLLLRAKAKIEFKWIFFFWFRVWHGEFMLPAWLVITFWFLEDFVQMMLTAQDTTQHGGVAFAAHVGGTICGMVLMALVKWRLKYAPLVLEEDDEEAEPAPMIARRPERMVPARMRVSLPAADTETPSILLFSAGQQSGPFTSTQIHQMFRSGQMAADTIYWQEGMDDWRSVDELRDPGVA